MEQLFTQTVNQHLSEIHRFCAFMLRDSAEAEDITQKTFIKYYENLKSVQDPKPWLYKVARNMCLDHLKIQKSLSFTETEDFVYNIPEHTLDMEEKFDNKEFLEKARTIIADLPLAQKEVMLLKYFEDFTFEQIAAALGMPENTVKSHFYRGKQKLYDQL
ncbi:MAG TPA: RNA polymerase sigma factor, partial [Patescibacteria group bacterium]|nr:RNA polymerase sigma factor [Patescibacteria group bacterium]